MSQLYHQLLVTARQGQENHIQCKKDEFYLLKLALFLYLSVLQENLKIKMYYS